MKLYVITVSGTPQAGPVNTPTVRAVHASCAGLAIKRVLTDMDGIEKHLKRGSLCIRVERPHEPKEASNGKL